MKWLACLTLVAMLQGLCGIAAAQDSAIRVGSKLFTEQIVHGHIILTALENAGFEVIDRTSLGPTNVVRAAILEGEIDIYPEYTGTALFVHLYDMESAPIPPPAFRDSALGYSLVSSYDAAFNDLVWLTPSPANSAYAFAVKREFAEEYGIYSASDMADYVNADGDTVVASGDEFATRPDGIASFEATYGFELRDDQVLVIPDATPAETSQALLEDRNGANFAMVYTTDGALLQYDFVVLDDPLSAQPLYEPAPVVRGEVLRANPSIAGILNPIFASINAETIQALNFQIEVAGESPADVAQSWLSEMGFIDG